MKQSILGFILLYTLQVFGQSTNEVQVVLDKIITHAQEASLYRNNINWDSVKPQVYKLAKEAESVNDLSPALKYLLKSLGDEHGRVFHNNQIIAHYYSGELKDHLKTFDPKIYNKIQMAQTYYFHTEMLENEIGYIRIVGLPMGDNEKMASEIQTEVCDLINAGAKNWIVDLRYNGGGNMHPMAEGIALLIGDDIVGGSQGLTNTESSVWRVENGDFFYDEYSIELQDDCAPKNLPKIAVLTSVYTASSGEALAVIFKGRDKTKFFGQKTFGMITVTDWEVIDETTAMTISVSYYKDRNGNVYNEFVDVDKELPFVIEPLSENDESIRSAINWLKED
ncbi:hypothetical protein C5O00_13775 [Pukyongia salina]|uniref:Tail specific protease domain-containing protein n=1 Tax=Pukyongia salina TaxID=2094025 RepID=A0A2S0I011_9FLAO|nr:S41 family peptidase [Pukyongia salina]AVI52164.1 hypothetical protein C5O00_13775 [Pukyongia salina]